jgi:hypothetical protein
MKTLTEYLKFHTKNHREYIHITPQVEAIVKKSGVKEGMVLVSAMHITAGVYVNDNESGLIADIVQPCRKTRQQIRALVPRGNLARPGPPGLAMFARPGSPTTRLTIACHKPQTR